MHDMISANNSGSSDDIGSIEGALDRLVGEDSAQLDLRLELGDEARLPLASRGTHQVGAKEASIGDGDLRLCDLCGDARRVQDFEVARGELLARRVSWRAETSC